MTHWHYNQVDITAADMIAHTKISQAIPSHRAAYTEVQDLLDRAAPEHLKIAEAADLWRCHGVDDDFIWVYNTDNPIDRIIWHVFSCPGDCPTRAQQWLAELAELTSDGVTISPLRKGWPDRHDGEPCPNQRCHGVPVTERTDKVGVTGKVCATCAKLPQHSLYFD